MTNKRKKYINSCEISEVKTYKLHQLEQKVLIEGKSKSNPIIIFLHGGPGSPVPFNVGCRGLYPNITTRFTAVYWDQYGCGINNHPVSESFSIDDFVEMTIDLVSAIEKDYPNIPINLFGVSWGSLLATKVAERIPSKIHSVFVYGQVIKQLFFNEEVYKAFQYAKLSSKKRKTLDNVIANKEKNDSDYVLMSTYIKKYTEGYFAKTKDKLHIRKIIKGLLASPDYSLKDFKAIMNNGMIKNRSIMHELVNMDITPVLRNIQVPYLIMQGSTDIVTPTAFVKTLVEEANNPFLKLKIYENCGHIPGDQAMIHILEQGFEFINQKKI